MTKAPTFSATLQAGALQLAARTVETIIPSTIRIPILGNALLSFASQETLVLLSTDLDRNIRFAVPAEGQGTVTVDASRLKQAAALLDEDAAVSLVADDRRLTVKQGRYSVKLPTLPDGDFPASLAKPEGEPWRLPAAELVGGFKALEYAVPKSDTRIYLNGVYLDNADPAAPRFVGTDGHVLGMVTLNSPAPAHIPSVTIPRDSVLRLGPLCKEVGGDIEVFADRERLAFHAGPLRFTTKAVVESAVFPDYRRLIRPDACETHYRVSAAELRRAARRAGLAREEKSNIMRVELRDGEIELAGMNAIGEEAGDACAAKRLAGGDMTIGIDADLLAETLESLGPDGEMELRFESPGSAVHVRLADDEAWRSLRLLMPAAILNTRLQKDPPK